MEENNSEFERYGEYALYGICVSNIESYGPIPYKSHIETNFSKNYPKKVILHKFAAFLDSKTRTFLQFTTRSRKDLEYPTEISKLDSSLVY